ncbi:MAG TPA: BsuBI/PstI family type II restriction endonuclease [Candidatus Acidoferrum sp.]|nr:BsuBI/PstI family type II restriction endonuclease [Candidatus Acidoferrum sp.]
MPLPQLVPVEIIAKWLPEVFPEGTANRTYLVRQMAARTIFVMLYAGAVEGNERWLRPDQVTKMTDAQAARSDELQREQWAARSLIPGGMKHLAKRWYAANTREPIRDETLRAGLVAVGAVVERPGLPTTSAKPRYALSRDFSDLLVKLAGRMGDPPALIAQWQAAHLTATALNRINLLRRGAVASMVSERVKVTFPNGETRLMLPGPSTVITKAVIEVFATAFLRQPGVIFLSESGNKVVARDEDLATSIGLRLDYSRNLPDIVLADVHPETPKVVFVEVIATDGAITVQRKGALSEAAAVAGLKPEGVYFVSAFADRSAPAFRKLVSELAWGTFAWFVSEPEKLLAFREGQMSELSALFKY